MVRVNHESMSYLRLIPVVLLSFLFGLSAVAGDVQRVREYLGNGEWGMVGLHGRGDLKPNPQDSSRLMFYGFPKSFAKRRMLLDIPYSQITRMVLQQTTTTPQGITQTVITPRTSLGDAIGADIANSIMNAPRTEKFLTIYWTDELGAERGAMFALIESFSKNGKMLEDLERRTAQRIRQID